MDGFGWMGVLAVGALVAATSIVRGDPVGGAGGGATAVDGGTAPRAGVTNGGADDGVLALPPDSPRWALEGNARVASFLGRPALRLEGAVAMVKDLVFRDGVVDLDMATVGSRGFAGLLFRAVHDGADAEWVYLRPHKSGLPDALQYTPLLGGGANWQLYSGPGFTAAVDLPRGAWFHVRLEVTGAQARLFVGDMARPALVMDDLKSGVERGALGLYVLAGETYVSDVRVRPTPDAPFGRHWPPMPPGTLVHWQLSPSLDALAQDPERLPGRAALDALAWEDVTAEPPGLVAVSRHREAPHPRVTFQTDWSTRLQPQPGARVVYARTTVTAGRAGLRKLALGYSDEVSVFLNGRILWRGRSAQGFRDPGFLGIVSADDDAVWLPLRAGRNELVLAVTELGGGWGFVARLEGAPP